MPVEFLPAFVGASVNGSGTRIATIKAIGSNPVDTANPNLFSGMQVQYYGTQFIPVDEAIEMGILQWDNVGLSLSEMNGLDGQPYATGL